MFFLFSPGEMIQFDEHIFQMGWFNHQLESLVFQISCELFSIKNWMGPYQRIPK